MSDIISVTTLKQNTAEVMKKVKEEPIVVVQRSEPAAVLVDPKYFKKLENALEELEDLRAIEKRNNEPRIPFEEVKNKLLRKRSI